MTRIECPVCYGWRSATSLTRDGEAVYLCTNCGDPGWVNPWPLTDDPTDGRPHDRDH